ncbi:ABC transporter ATP-binding component [Limosilactobacillus gastricus DSM 16045]|uniref:ABC transporter ATP-binding component n=2 Tax=Limosilactobacillus gastricus TaxID=227942 RepID=A0A0R1VE68_9LACO|nr:ABC transporter ATP-binding component [Limosilactobacillus gastricus DSM 16045]
MAQPALTKITTTFKQGATTAIIGHTGSGKSTLMQLIDGLILPTAGSITLGDFTITNETPAKELGKLRRLVGYVFQFPEKQLFAESVLDDVKFGPLNQGLSDEKAQERAQAALEQLNFPLELLKHSPFELSGGQQRRVAIAGVLAMHPEILILDEPTVGLDPEGQAELLTLVRDLQDQGLMILIVTHQMEIVAQLADEVMVLNHGQLAFQGSPQDLFIQSDLLADNHLRLPKAIQLATNLGQRGITWDGLPLTTDQLADQIIQMWRDQDE